MWAGTSTNIDPTNPNSPKTARQPNSFVYRFVPQDVTNISRGGVLQALQVMIDGQLLVFGGTTAAQVQADVFAVVQLKLHTPGTSWPVKWVDVHDSRGCAPNCPSFDANAEAKKAGVTPFKRPENLAFRPGLEFPHFLL
jgi:secreted PhoX family phosphatase